MHYPVILFFPFALLLVACNDEKQAADSGKTTAGLADAHRDEAWRRPSDGRLTDFDVQTYLKVRAREKVRAQAAGETALTGSGVSVAEYEWIREAVDSALAARAELRKMDEVHAALTKRRAAESNPDLKNTFTGLITELERRQRQIDPVVADNERLLMKYAAELDAVVAEIHLATPSPVGGEFYVFEGRVEPGASLFIDEQEVEVAANGSFRKLLALSEPRTEVAVRTVDRDGNRTERRQTIPVSGERSP